MNRHNLRNLAPSTDTTVHNRSCVGFVSAFPYTLWSNARCLPPSLGSKNLGVSTETHRHNRRSLRAAAAVEINLTVALSRGWTVTMARSAQCVEGEHNRAQNPRHTHTPGLVVAGCDVALEPSPSSLARLKGQVCVATDAALLSSSPLLSGDQGATSPALWFGLWLASGSLSCSRLVGA